MDLKFYTLLDFFMQFENSPTISYYVLYVKKYPPLGANYYSEIDNHFSNEIDKTLIASISRQLSNNFYGGSKNLFPRAFQGNNIISGENREQEELAYMSRHSRPNKSFEPLRVLTDGGTIELQTRVWCMEFEKRGAFIRQGLPFEVNLKGVKYNQHLESIDFLDDDYAEKLLTSL